MRLEPDEAAYAVQTKSNDAHEVQPRTSVYLAREIQSAAREYAQKRKWTFSKLVTLALREFMKAHG